MTTVTEVSFSSLCYREIAIHSLFRYAALRDPEHADSIACTLAIRAKRFERALVNFLSAAEVDALWWRPTARRGPGGVTTPCCSSPCKRACESLS